MDRDVPPDPIPEAEPPPGAPRAEGRSCALPPSAREPSLESLRRTVLDGRSRDLGDSEILAVLLGTGNVSTATLRLARGLVHSGLLARDGGGALLQNGSRRIGRVRRARLLAAMELARRLHPTPAGVGPPAAPLETPRQVFEWARPYARREKEHFLVLQLNTRHVPKKLEVVSVGSLNASIVHPREVFRSAILEAAAALILVHNHPSGDPTPSRDDICTTDRLARVGEMVGIHVLDHVILAGESFFSFKEEGLMTGRGER
jgi:DNA repair protein RadC